MKDRRKHHRRRAPRPFRIVFEDPHVLVADKDSGVLTVPIPEKRSLNLKELLDEYLAPQKREALPVHRIDRYTSGLVVFAKNRKAWENLVAQFRARSPERVYLALARGDVPIDEGTLRDRLELTSDGFRQRVVSRGGTEAVTHFRVLERLPGATLLEVRLETGLKNQIRIQLRSFGFPLVGDRHYAKEEEAEVFLKRQALHAFRLGFTHPATGKLLTFEAPLAPDMERLLSRLRSVPAVGAREIVLPERRGSSAGEGDRDPARQGGSRSRGGRGVPGAAGRQVGS